MIGDGYINEATQWSNSSQDPMDIATVGRRIGILKRIIAFLFSCSLLKQGVSLNTQTSNSANCALINLALQFSQKGARRCNKPSLGGHLLKSVVVWLTSLPFAACLEQLTAVFLGEL